MNPQSNLSTRNSLDLSGDKRTATRKAIVSAANLSAAYLAMNVAAALIAGLGLLENSPAVIIGAMLIAMLYGPIIGIGLGLAEADLRILGRFFLADATVACASVDLRTRHFRNIS